jgi:hypothetical protein
VKIGEIYRHSMFYADSSSGQLRPKFFLVLATTADTDLVVRLLTSRHEGLRPEQPPCCHDDPYAGFYLGVPGGSLGRKTWLDLRALEDLDGMLFQVEIQKGIVTLIGAIGGAQLRAAMECAAGAQDTTRCQERSIRDALAKMS